MRHILLFFILIFTLNASTITMQSDYKTALQVAKKKQQPLLIYLSMPHCKTCEYMNKEVLNRVDIVTYINTHYIVVHLNADDHTLPRKLRTNVSPVFHFIDPRSGEMIESIRGGRSTSKFLKLLQRSYSDYKATP